LPIVPLRETGGAFMGCRTGQARSSKPGRRRGGFWSNPNQKSVEDVSRRELATREEHGGTRLGETRWPVYIGAVAHGWLAASLIVGLICGVASRASASDLDVRWDAPRGCPGREQLREAIARRVGREISFGADAPLHLSAVITAQDGGYELALSTRSQSASEERRLQARTCGELVRASLLIAAVLLSAESDPARVAAPVPPTPPQAPNEARGTAIRDGQAELSAQTASVSGRSPSAIEPRAAPGRAPPMAAGRAHDGGAGDAQRPDAIGRERHGELPVDGLPVLSARLRALGDLGSLAAASVGPGIALGVDFGRTRLELGGIWLPSQDVNADSAPAVASMGLLAASASVCQAFFDGPTLAPCLQLEAGRLDASGRELPAVRSAGAAWFMFGLGVRFALRLLEPLYACAQASAGLTGSRPRLAVEGLGVVHRVPALVGRLELGIEVRL
jgi:hypothetical protein